LTLLGSTRGRVVCWGVCSFTDFGTEGIFCSRTKNGDNKVNKKNGTSSKIIPSKFMPPKTNRKSSKITTLMATVTAPNPGVFGSATTLEQTPQAGQQYSPFVLYSQATRGFIRFPQFGQAGSLKPPEDVFPFPEGLDSYVGCLVFFIEIPPLFTDLNGH
jgi:hypothetical protein